MGHFFSKTISYQTVHDFSASFFPKRDSWDILFNNSLSLSCWFKNIRKSLSLWYINSLFFRNLSRIPFFSKAGFFARERIAFHRESNSSSILFKIKRFSFPWKLCSTRCVDSSASLGRGGPILGESIQRFLGAILRWPWRCTLGEFWGAVAGRAPLRDPRDTPARAWWWCVIAGMRACVNVDTSSPLMNKGRSVTRETRRRILLGTPMATGGGSPWHRRLTLFLHLGEGNPGCRGGGEGNEERGKHSPTGGSKQGQALYLSFPLTLPLPSSTRSSKTSWPLSWCMIGRW